MLNIRELILNKHFLFPFTNLIFITLLINVCVNISEFVLYNDVLIYLKNIAIHSGLYDVVLALVKPFLLFSQTFIYLSSTANNNISLELFLASITIFIIFFSFAQFSLSNSTIPNQLIKKYILKDNRTYRFIGYHVGVAIVLGCFTLMRSKIININNLIGIFLVLISFIYTILYFFWMIKIGAPVELLKYIISNLNISEIKTFENKALKTRKAFNQQLLESNFKIKFSLNTFSFYINELYPLHYDKCAIVSEIDLREINNLLLPYKENIREVIIEAQIGDYLPKVKPYYGQESRSILLLIHMKINTITMSERKKTFNDLFKKNNLDKKLINCFKFHPRSEIQTQNIEVIKEIFILYYYAIEHDQVEAKYLNKVLIEFLNTEFLQEKNEIWNSEIGLIQNLFIDFINILGKDLSQKELTSGKIEVINQIIYSFRVLASRSQSVRLMNKLLDVTYILFTNMINDSNKFNNRIATMIQTFKEIGIYSIFYADPAPDKISFCRNWGIFYSHVIINTFDYSITSLKYLIYISYKRTERDNLFIITNNINALNDFMNHLIYNDYIQDYLFNNSAKSIIRKYDYLKYFLNKILQLCIYVYSNVRRNTIPLWMLDKISFKLMDDFISPSSGLYEKADIYNDLFYNPDFQLPNLSAYSDEFNLYAEQNDNESYIGYNIQDEFWIIYSLHCCRINQDIIPNKLIGQTKQEIDANKNRISIYKNKHTFFDAKAAKTLLNISAEQYIDYIANITNKLEKLIA